MATGFFSQFLGQPNQPARQHAPSRGDWSKIIDALVSHLGDYRNQWFALCIRLLKDKPNVRTNPRITSEADIAARVFQSIDALEAVAAKRYIEPSDGRDFANQFFAAITEGSNLLLTNQLHRELRNAHDGDQGGDVFLLCSYATEAILTQQDVTACMEIARTVPLFTNLNHTVVAAAFGDSATLRELEQKRENACGSS